VHLILYPNDNSRYHVLYAAAKRDLFRMAINASETCLERKCPGKHMNRTYICSILRKVEGMFLK
jgi:hypothetical protein